jgi:hypothetical protein
MTETQLFGTPRVSPARRVARALDVALVAGGDAARAQWVIDQMVRALTGCSPIGETEPLTGDVIPSYGESAEYRAFVEEFACVCGYAPSTEPGRLDRREWDTGAES